MSKSIKTRIQNKHDIEANWLQAENFKPLAGEIIIYDPDSTHSVPRVKIGDGNSLLKDLYFIDKEIAAHMLNTTSHITAAERTSWNTHVGSAHAPSNAEKNQNAFSNVIVGSTTIAADTATDSLTLVAGNNITITPDATNDKITITATNTDTHYKASPHAGTSSSTSATATTNGNTYINIVENGARSGGINIKGAGATTVTSDANGVITVSSTDNNTTYNTGTSTTSGLTKLYTATGSNTDGTMTQQAITTAINGLITCGTEDPNTNTTGLFYFKYAVE